MVYVRKPKAATSNLKVLQPQLQPVVLDPALQKKQQVAHTMRRFTARPASEQKQLARPTLTALRLYGEEYARVEGARPALQAQALQQAKSLPPTAVRDALGRQLAQQAPLPLIAAPKSQADWVTVMRQQAAQAESRLLGQKEVAQYTALQRQVTDRLLQGFRQDRQEPAVRYAEYAEHLVNLQRHASSGRVAGAFLTLMPQGERPALQRAIDETLQREAQQQVQDDAALSLHSLQRQLAELDQQATQPVYDRIKARRGAGNPLPEAVRRHLEHGLNHDLGAVRIHDDAEADHLSKSVNALAFTTGTDIYFQSGKFNPNSQSGLELLAHEVTHTVQQSKGRVGKGLDPDAGLENEARDMGRKLASISPRSLIAPMPHVGGPYARGVYNQRDSLARVQAGAANHALLSPLRSLQRQSDQTIQRSFVGDKLSELAGQISGYKPLTMALGYDPVAGKAIQADPNALLDALGNFVPGPFKDMLKVVREQKLVDKAWTWFKAELGKLQLGKVITDIKDALSGLPNIGKAKNILVSAVGRVKNLVTGSARKLAEMAITAISAGLGPVGKQIMASLSQAGDVITQVLKNPAQFAKNLMNAMKQGFTGFVDRSGKWIQQGLGDFLTGSANIQIPKNLNVEGVLMTALSLMDLTYAALRGRLVKELGTGAEKKIAFLEQAGGALGQLKGGVGKAPEMKAVASKVGGEVLGGIKTEVTETLVKKGIAKVALMFNPAGAAIGAIMTAWSTIQTVIDKGKQIMSVIMNALSSIKEIAAGNVAGAAGYIEQTVGKALPVVFSFAANFLGIGNIGTRIKNLVRGMRQKLGIDKFIDGIVARLKKLVGAGKQVAGEGVTNNQATADRNSKLTDKEKNEKLSRAVKSIEPRFKNLISKTPTAKDVKATLEVWKKEFDLTDLAFDHNAGAAALFVKVNPSQKAGSAYLFNINDDVTLRRLTKLVASNLLGEPKVQAQAREMRRQDFLLRKKGDYLGSKQSPIKLQSGLALLAQISYWRSFGKASEQYPVPGRMPPLNDKGQIGRDKLQYYQHSETPAIVSAAQPQFNPNNEHVKGGGHYLEGQKAIIGRISAMNSRGLSDRAIALALLGLIRGESPVGFKETEITMLKSLKQMLFSSESKRSGENIVNAAMLVTRVSRGSLTWKAALENLPMHPVGAEAAKRELGRSDKKTESPTTGSLAAKIAELEAKVTAEYVKVMSKDLGFVLQTISQAQRLVEREMRKFYGL